MSNSKFDVIHHSRQPKKLPHRVVNNILSPVETFFAMETASGILLMVTAILAMIWANSPLYHYYEEMLEYPLGFQIGNFLMTKSLHHWVNDGLMVIFFFVVGLEIKRELIIGELSSPKKAALPMVAALGGMVVPALIYVAFNREGPGMAGWGIPMATDIAFAVGILTLMSRKCPLALKVFLLALAIVDDLGAVLVIALFYTDQISSHALGLAAFVLFFTLFLKYAGVKKLGVYWVLGILTWFAVLKSGVHSTVAGVILGLMTPVAPFYDINALPQKFRDLVDRVNRGVDEPGDDYKGLSYETHHAIDELDELTRESRSPLDRLIHMLHPWVSYFIMPVFALFNAGVHLGDDFQFSALFTTPISIGVILGLLVGKPVGVLLSSWLAVKFNFAQLPRGVSWFHMTAVGFLAGIGFTMALFIGHLALKVPDIEIYSKLGILVASGLAGTVGSILLAMSKDVKDIKGPLPENTPS